LIGDIGQPCSTGVQEHDVGVCDDKWSMKRETSESNGSKGKGEGERG